MQKARLAQDTERCLQEDAGFTTRVASTTTPLENRIRHIKKQSGIVVVATKRMVSAVYGLNY